MDASHAGTVPRMPLCLAESHFVTTPFIHLVSECSTIGKYYIIARAFLKITSCFFLPKNTDIGTVFREFQKQHFHSHSKVYNNMLRI